MDENETGCQKPCWIVPLIKCCLVTGVDLLGLAVLLWDSKAGLLGQVLQAEQERGAQDSEGQYDLGQDGRESED